MRTRRSRSRCAICFYNKYQYLNYQQNNTIDFKDLALNYITNEAEEKTAVILPVTQFEQLLEDLEYLATVDERRDEITTTQTGLIA